MQYYVEPACFLRYLSDDNIGVPFIKNFYWFDRCSLSLSKSNLPTLYVIMGLFLSKLSYYSHKLHGTSLKRIVGKLSRRIRVKVRDIVLEIICRSRYNYYKSVSGDNLYSVNYGVLLPRIKISHYHLQGRFFLDQKNQNEYSSRIREMSSEVSDRILMDADQIYAHIFNLLGSGCMHLGKHIDWHSDFKSGHCWNPQRFYRRIRSAGYPGGYDIKIPWELSRFHHLVRLGQAYWLSGDEKYTYEFINQITNWIQDNPWPFGVNWASTMEISIRAVNWLWGYYFFQESPVLNREFRQMLITNLMVHGSHIMNNLDWTETSRTNHYLSNIVGLVYLGILLPEQKMTQHWREFGLRELENEMITQGYRDGVDYEASVSYHRLVVEMFLSSTILANINGFSFSKAYMKRLDRMLEFIMYVTKPDGTTPLIGDNDNGRLHRLSVWEDHEREWIDHRYLLSIGAFIFQRNDFAIAGGEQWQEAFWLFGPEALDLTNRKQSDKTTLQLKSRAFSNSGLYIMRNEDLYMIIDAGDNGQQGLGGHGHNDTFSFEFYASNQTWIVDPGTSVYTDDYIERHLFRSTISHNTIIVDGLDQNRCFPNEPFWMYNDCIPNVLDWKTGDETDYFLAEHTGYKRLPDPVIHRREIVLNKTQKTFIVRDWLCVESNSNCHEMKQVLHFSPLVSVADIDIMNGRIVLKGKHPESWLMIKWDNLLDVTLGHCAVALGGYGTKQDSKCLSFYCDNNRMEIHFSWG